MFEFDRHHSAEKQMNFEKRQEMLASSATWLRQILDEKRDPDDCDSIAITPATPDEFYYQNKHGSISVYDLINAIYVEFSVFDSHDQRQAITHFVLNQGRGGVWQLQTTGDLYKIPSLHLEFDEWRGLELSDHDERLSEKEPLYPEYQTPATPDEVALFHETVERGVFGNSRFDFSQLNAFMARTAAILDDIERLTETDPTPRSDGN